MIVRRQHRRFTLMAAGAHGSGRSSFFNTLIGKDIVAQKDSGIDLYMLSIDCEGVTQKITLIDTPGFGETLDDTDTQNSICSFIRTQFNLFMAEEAKIRRNPKYEDSRVHCLLYFIPATSSGLKNTDVVFLKKVSSLVNIIPVISKCDGLATSERMDLKRRVVEQMHYYGIPLFDLDNPDLHAPPASGNNLNAMLPFLIVSADTRPPFRTRNYLWGSMSIDNPAHSDLPTLRELLLSTHIQGLIDYTASELYENYRVAALEGSAQQN